MGRYFCSRCSYSEEGIFENTYVCCDECLGMGASELVCSECMSEDVRACVTCREERCSFCIEEESDICAHCEEKYSEEELAALREKAEKHVEIENETKGTAPLTIKKKEKKKCSAAKTERLPEEEHPAKKKKKIEA